MVFITFDEGAHSLAKRNNGLRIGINGFGRIGRALTRVLMSQQRHTITHINDTGITSVEQASYLLKYDSIYGRFHGEVEPLNGAVAVRHDSTRNPIHVTLGSSPSTLQVDWLRRGVDVVVEATGNAGNVANSRHLVAAGIPYVVVTSNFNEADATIVPGVHDRSGFPLPGAVLSAATCDVVAAGPLVDALMGVGQIERLHAVTIHPWLNHQHLVDGPLATTAGAINQGNFGLGRAATMSVIPKATSLEPALSALFPALAGRIRAHSYRVPTPIVSYADLCVDLDKPTSRSEIVAVLKKKMPVVGLSEEPVVSCDLIGDGRAAIVDLRWLRVEESRISLVYAYDNEWGYASYVVEIINRAMNELVRLDRTGQRS